MVDFEDYYEVLGVSPDATPEELKRVYKDKCWILSPDRMAGTPESARKRAEKELAEVNRAYDILSDPQKRRQYHADWLQKKGSIISSAKGQVFAKPKPIIDPPGIIFKNIKPGETKKTSFLVINIGGPYTKIHISNPDSWLKISDWHSISTNDELPLKVNIIAQADDSGRKRSENIYVQLDDIQTYITVILEPKMRMEIRDHNWHDVGFQDLNWWAQGQFNSGKAEFKGKYFEYRMNQITGKYQFRLQHKHKSAIYAP